MNILKHSSSEYYITMPGDSDLESFDDGLDKLCDDGIIFDFDNTEFEAALSGMSDAFKPPGKEVHIYLDVNKDTEEIWKTIGNTLAMSLDDLNHAKKLMTRVYNADFKDIPEGSLWDKPLPGAKKVEDDDGSMIMLDRLDQFREDNSIGCDWLDERLLFYLGADEDATNLIQGINDLLLQTEEA